MLPEKTQENAVQPFQGLYETSAEQNFALGTPYVLPDGRMFRYAKAGGTKLNKGEMTQGVAAKSDYTSMSLLASASAGTDVISIAGTTTHSTLSNNELAGGTLIVHNGNGKGQLFKIASHDAYSPTTTGDNLAVKLETSIQTKISSGDTVSFYANRYNGVVVTPKAAVSAPLTGVPLVDIPSGEYGWLQVRGPSPLLVNTGESLATGDTVGEPFSTSDSGACGAYHVDQTTATSAIDNKVYGWVMSPAAPATQFATIFLTLE